MYEFIYKATSNTIKVYETWREAQEEAGRMIDDEVDTYYEIKHSIKGKIMGTYELKDFVSRTQPDNFTLDVTAKNIKEGLRKSMKPGKDLERERFHNLDDQETAEVLKHTSTGALIGELVRRSQEYESTVEQISKLLDGMKIYDVKH